MYHRWLFLVAALLLVPNSAALAQADDYGPDRTQRKEGSPAPMHFVLVSKSHFDIGYSALARDVEHEYRTTMIDRALETMEQNAKVAGPGEQFVWTIPGWPMDTILWEGQNPARRQRIEAALKSGNLVMHALPFTLETGTADVETLARSFHYATAIARRYNLPLPNDAKMTDVPGHDWIVPTLLHHAGVKFFHFGSNPTNQQVKLPTIFWWEGPDGSRVLTMYSAGYDSGLLPPANWPHKTWLAMVMGGDNQGPPSAAEVRGWIATIRQRFPGAKITVGRMEDFADSLLAEKPDLPVVRGNVSDSWIHGLMSSPAAASAVRNARPKLMALESLRTLNVLRGVQPAHPAGPVAEGYDNSLRWSEHTWGLANQHFIPSLYGEPFYKEYVTGLSPHYVRMVESWKEHDRFAERADEVATARLEAELHTLAENVSVEGLRIVVYNPLAHTRDGVVDFAFPFMGNMGGTAAMKAVGEGDVQHLRTWGNHSRRIGRFIARNVPALGYKTYVVSNEKPADLQLAGDTTAGTIENKWFKVTFDPVRGSIRSILDKATGAQLVDARAKHGFGQYVYERFSKQDVTDYVRSYILPQYQGSHGPITGKSHYVPADAKRSEFSPSGMGLQIARTGGEVTGTLIPPSQPQGAHTASLSITLFGDLPYIDLKVAIVNHPATEDPEAGWIALPFAIERPQFRIAGPGSICDPATEMIEGSNFAFFWTQLGAAIFDGQSGRGVGLCSPDAPAVSFGSPGSFKFIGRWHSPSAAAYIHLFNNQWNTNFRSFWSGELTARVRIWTYSAYDAEKSLATPAVRTLSPLVSGLSNYRAGPLPVRAVGIEVTRPGVAVTALGPDESGQLILRLWEQAGTEGPCTVTLPSPSRVRSAQPVDLRGTPRGEPIRVEDGRFTVPVGRFQPVTLILSE